MAKKAAPAKARAKTASRSSASRVKVGSNRSSSPSASSFMRTKRTGLVVVLVFMIIGAGTIAWVKAATSTYTLWTTTTIPKTITDPDRQGTEVGMKFRTQYAGQVSGMRFYKGPQNTGTHRGNLWSSDGQRLATVIFTNETVSGWQTANFATPVNIAANTTYTISYFAPRGHYSVDENYFVNARVNGPLTGLKTGTDGGNGVYAYSSRSSFPRQTFNASNYWVDVIYSTSKFSPSPKPAAPTNLTASLSGTSVTLTWNYSSTAGINHYEVLRGGTVVANSVTGRSWIDASLATGQTYSYQVRAVDDSGQPSDLSNTAKVTVPAPEPTPTPTPTPTPSPTPTPPPTTGSSTCPLPKYPSDGCTGNKWVLDTSHFTSTGSLVIDSKYIANNGNNHAVSNLDVKGSVTITEPGVALANVRVSGDVTVSAQNALIIDSVVGSINVGANNTTIGNTTVNGPVVNDSGSVRYSFTIQDSTVGQAGVCNSYGNGAIGVSNYTARRVRVLNFPDGFRVAGSDVLIEDSYVTTCSQNSSDHSDGLQVYGAEGGSNIFIRHNTIDESRVTNGAANAAIFFPGDGDRQGNNNAVIGGITDNLIAGGGYTMYVPGPGSPITITALTGNKVVNNTWEYQPFGVECSFVRSAGNNSVVTYDFTTGTVLSTVRAITDCM